MYSNLAEDSISSDKTNKDSSFYEESLSVILKDAIKYAPSKVLGMIMNIAAVSIYTNLLLPKEYGLYMVATSVISFLAIIFSDWIGTAALRFFREHYNNKKVEQYFSTVLFLLVSNLSIMYILGFFLYKPLGKFFEIPEKFLILVFLLLIPIAIRALLFQVLRAQIKPLAYTFSVIVNQVFTIALGVFLIKQFHLTTIALLLAMGISIAFIDVVMLVQTKFHKDINHEKIQYAFLPSLYTYGVPLALSSLGMWIITQSNRFILQHFKGSYFNGQLGVGYNLTFSIMMPLFAIITLAAIPRIINLYEDGKDVKQIISKLTELFFLWFLPVTLFLCLYPKEIVMFFSNKKFEDAFVIIPFLAMSAFILGLTEITTIQYHLAKKTHIDMGIRLFSGFLGIIFTLLALPKFGLLGVGISTLASHFTYLLLSCFIKTKEISWKFPYRGVINAFIATALSAACVFGLSKLVASVSVLGFVSHAVIFAAVYVLFIKLQNIYKSV
jgi:O-antigen/teichoic acid export membrane protein